jgi:hypothetical protein
MPLRAGHQNTVTQKTRQRQLFTGSVKFLGPVSGIGLVMPLPLLVLQNEITFIDDFVGSISTPISSTAGTGANTEAATIAPGPGGRVTLKSSTALGTNADNGSMLTLDALDWRADQGGLTMECLLSVDDVTQVAVVVGFTDAISTTVELPFFIAAGTDDAGSDAVNACGMGFDTDALTEEFFHGGVAAGVDATPVFSGGAPANGVDVALSVQVSDSGDVQGFVDGIAVGPPAVGAVASTVPLTPFITVSNRSASQRVITLDYIFVQASR